MRITVKTRVEYFFFIAIVFLTAGCTNSNPAIELLQKTLSPTKGGVSEWTETLRDLSQAPTITGECDPRATGIDYSLDGGTSWTSTGTLAGADADCTDHTFSFTFPAAQLGFQERQSDRRTLLIRQQMGGSNTTAAIVTMKYIAPLGPRPDHLRLVLGKLKPASGLPFDIKIRAYARGAAR